MRVAFTIVLNGVHHLKHNDFAKSMKEMFDLWVIVEGACDNNGSTNWCRPALEKYHKNGHSVDGTVGFIEGLEDGADNVRTVKRDGVWASKDQMVNTAIARIEAETHNQPCYLWEVDVDEQWSLKDIEAAERQLSSSGGKTGKFHADFYVGPGLLAVGAWGEGLWLPYNRLWIWDGSELFQKHEPPTMSNGNEPEILLSQRFKHYAYFFEKDVEFKDSWYSNHSGILENWRNLQKRDKSKFPCPMTELTPFSWGDQGTQIVLE